MSYRHRPGELGYKPRVLTFSNGKPMCDECCHGDRCDDDSHWRRKGPNVTHPCPWCDGTGTPKPLSAADQLRQLVNLNLPGHKVWLPDETVQLIVKLLEKAEREIKSEWTGTDGPFGSGAEWLADYAKLAEMLNGNP